MSLYFMIGGIQRIASVLPIVWLEEPTGPFIET